MDASKRTGRLIGVLLVLQMVGSAMVNGFLEAPLFGAPGFLVNAAPHSWQIGLAALLGLATEAVWVGVAVAGFPVFWQHARSLALWFLALAGVTLAVAVVENSAVMSMVSLSEAYTQASAVDRGQFELIRVVVASARNWVHFMARILDGVTIFFFCAVLYRFTLVPRVLAGFGLIAVTLMMTSVGRPLFGRDVVFPLLAPLGLSQLMLAVWLIARGFRVEPRPKRH